MSVSNNFGGGLRAACLTPSRAYLLIMLHSHGKFLTGNRHEDVPAYLVLVLAYRKTRINVLLHPRCINVDLGTWQVSAFSPVETAPLLQMTLILLCFPALCGMQQPGKPKGRVPWIAAIHALSLLASPPRRPKAVFVLTALLPAFNISSRVGVMAAWELRLADFSVESFDDMTILDFRQLFADREFEPGGLQLEVMLTGGGV